MLDRQRSSYSSLLPAAAAVEEEAGLPALKDGEYQAHGRPANKPVFAVHFINARREVRSFQYQHLESDSRFEGGCIRLRFLAEVPVRVTIHGRNLWRLYDCLHRRVMPWVMEAGRGRDFGADGETVVSGVEFVEVRE
jgi:hypothetical protein